jgi:selenide,water dikinase
VLQQLPKTADRNLLVGIETADDAAVYKISEEVAYIHTVDFFTPIVDNPYMFGQIAAANALSDVYAMGGTPLTALNIVCFPVDLPLDVLKEILRGGFEKLEEAGVVMAGGHTVEDKEPKYGLSVVGQVNPRNIIRNSTARPGDVLVLTKPLGTGIIATAVKAEMVKDKNIIDGFMNSMAELNKNASEAMKKVGVNACTDITGFGLMGHVYEMAYSSKVTCVIDSKSIPVLPGTLKFAEMGLIPAGCYRNRNFVEKRVDFSTKIPESLIDVVFDPQTSGGLLIAVAEEKLDSLLLELKKTKVESHVIGRVVKQGESTITVV